jgi:virulence-associated protein VagC
MSNKPVSETAKVFMSGRSQAVRLPQAYRFNCDTVMIRRRGQSLLLTPVAATWDELCTGEPDAIEEMLALVNDDSLLPLEKRVELK